MLNTHSYNIGSSNYSTHGNLQSWDMWNDWKLNPYDGDLNKRLTRKKSTDPRELDIEKMGHIAMERARFLKENNYDPFEQLTLSTLKSDRKITINDIVNEYKLNDNEKELLTIIYKVSKTLDINEKVELYKQFSDICNDMLKKFKELSISSYEPKSGDIVKHFKNEIVDDKSEYLYEIIGVGYNSETNEKYVVYKSLYSNDKIKIGHICCRPYKMFLSEVDHEKYPNIKQKYRFEKVR